MFGAGPTLPQPDRQRSPPAISPTLRMADCPPVGAPGRCLEIAPRSRPARRQPCCGGRGRPLATGDRNPRPPAWRPPAVWRHRGKRLERLLPLVPPMGVSYAAGSGLVNRITTPARTILRREPERRPGAERRLLQQPKHRVVRAGRRLARAHSRFPGHALTPTGVMAIRCKQFHLPDL